MLIYRKILLQLIKKNISISIAESCTGGLLCHKITSIAGISKIFKMGLITYSNKSKSILLNINPKTIKKYGAVSEEISKLMASNLKKISKSKINISITGIAGPSGGNQKKPVGLVFITIIYNKKIHVFKKIFQGSRIIIQKKTVIFIFKEIEKLI